MKHYASIDKDLILIFPNGMEVNIDLDEEGKVRLYQAEEEPRHLRVGLARPYGLLVWST